MKKNFIIFILIICSVVQSSDYRMLDEHILEYYEISSRVNGGTKVENYKEWLNALIRRRNITEEELVDSITIIMDSVASVKEKWPELYIENTKVRAMISALCLFGNKNAINAVKLLIYDRNFPAQVLLLCSPVDWYPVCKHTILSEDSDMRYSLYSYLIERLIYRPDSTQETKEKILDLLCLAIGREINPEIVLELDNLLINLCGNAYQFSFERLDFMKSKFFSPEMRNLVREKKYLESREQAGIRIAKELQDNDNLTKFRPLENCSN